MNQYHYYLNFPVEIQKPSMFQIEHDLPKHEMLSMDLPEAIPMIKFINQFDNIECENLEYFYTPANGGKILIHSDNELDQMTKFNITWGPEEGVVQWWNCSTYNTLNTESGQTTYGASDTEHSVYIAEEKDSTKVYEANTNKLSMVNVGVFHSTYNPGSLGRYTLCFILRYKDSHKRLQWQDAVEIFKEYLND
jgi:hypothetical protein